MCTRPRLRTPPSTSCHSAAKILHMVMKVRALGCPSWLGLKGAKQKITVLTPYVYAYHLEILLIPGTPVLFQGSILGSRQASNMQGNSCCLNRKLVETNGGATSSGYYEKGQVEQPAPRFHGYAMIR